MATIYMILPLPVLQCDVGDVYVGSTTRSLRNRWSHHKSHFKQWLNGKCGNCSSYRLFEKYGVENTTCIEIEQCPLEKRKERESYYIGFYNGVNVRKLTIMARGGSSEYCNEYEAHRRENPEYREKQAEQAREYYVRNLEENPEFRAKKTEQARKRYARKKAEKLASQQIKSDCTRVLESVLGEVERIVCV